MDDLNVPVIGTDTGYLYVGHGDRCILIGEMDVPKWRNATGLTSEAARRLAAILIQQADAADQLVDHGTGASTMTRRATVEDVFSNTEHDAGLYEARRGQSDDS